MNGDPLAAAAAATRRPATNGVNNNDDTLSDSLRNLSLNGPAVTNGARRNSDRYASLSSQSPSTTRPSALRRSSSALSVDRRSASPALTRKTSTSSLRNGDSSGTPLRSSSRRSSAHFLSSPTFGGRSPLAPQMEEALPPPPTAASIAADHFRKELDLHGTDTSKVNTVVILHDACYGHRYSRPKTSKSTLSMIVERPERIHAGILGITSAYIRLGERHAEGQNPPHPRKEPNPALPFKIKRTSRSMPVTSPVVTNVHGTAWMSELKTMCESAGQKLATTGKELVRPDAGARGASAGKAKLHEGDLYLCSESLDAFQGALGGVCDGIDAVFEGVKSGQGPSSAFVCIRPPGHHCSADFPSGFCWLNNVHVGIEYATQTHGLTHAAIIDFDLHHGDGSQAITWRHNAKVAKMPAKTPASKKTAIGYFSLHDINSYPCEEGEDEKVQNASLCIENAHGQSIWNVHLQPWKTETEFWQLYESRYTILLDKARNFLRAHTQRLRSAPNLPQSKAAIFLSAGFDASEWESQGMQRHKVNVPTEFYARLTADVVKLSKEEDLAVDGRIISVLEGGYSDRALTSGVLSHLAGLCEGQTALEDEKRMQNGLAWDMGKQMAALALGTIDVKMEDEDEMPTSKVQKTYSYKPEWWHISSLSELELLSNPAPPQPPKKPARTGAPPTYSSPTQSFTAKVVDPTKIRTSSGRYASSTSPSRMPTPPPPDVDWATAAFELHKLLVPTDRETKSCKPEHLSETRAKKDRQSVIGPTQPQPLSTALNAGGRQLRDRKARAPNYADPQSDNESVTSRRSVSHSDRRRTIAEFPLVPSEENIHPGGRRLSVASNVSGVSGVAPNDAMNALTSGIQRIKIKVPTEEERAAKEAKRAADEAEKKKATTAARAGAKKTPAPRAAKVPASKKSAALSKSTVAPAVTAGRRVYPSPPHEPEITAALPVPAGVVPTVKLSPLPPPRPDTPPQPPPHIMPAQTNNSGPAQLQNDFVPWQPLVSVSAPPKNLTHQPQQLQWLPPNSDPSIRSAAGQNMPVFTSDSPIPFAPSVHVSAPPADLRPSEPPVATESATGNAETRKQVDIWDVPETPMK
ncbi:Arginase/deacetylase [Rhizodiscina lignyota]|uniref:Arginase/deacetylase n=1 Tax=Rhizodiscina lignyota TaxID=1504668 RepID=A0A9P4M249_9PEZI|nr:Arginase/deacetylase [Rhizodiscina lignyota]